MAANTKNKIYKEEYMLARMPQTAKMKQGIRQLWFMSIFALVSVALIGISHYVIREKEDGCNMSYMHPFYIRQNRMDSSAWTRFSKKYSLYLYREGGLEVGEEAYRVPLLFIPGNAGSYKQVRSLARASAEIFSELTNGGRIEPTEGKIGIDYFTLDLNEEFTAFNGKILRDQAEYVNDCIKYIFSLYKMNRPKYLKGYKKYSTPSSVIVVGHSMGGMVARTALALENYATGSISTMITLSTPHVSPTVTFNSEISELYTKVNKKTTEMKLDGRFNNISLVSIVGGDMDGMINSDLAYLDGLVDQKNGFTVMSSTMRGVWMSIDHQCILWCRQLVQVLAHTLYDILDARKLSQTVDVQERMRIFRHRLLSGEFGASDDIAGSKLQPTEKKTSIDVPENYVSTIHKKTRFVMTAFDTKDGHSAKMQVHILENPNKNARNSSESVTSLGLQFLAHTSRSTGESNIEYLNLMCCNPISSKNNPEVGSFIIENQSLDGYFSCTWLDPIRAAAIPTGKRGQSLEAQFVEMNANEFDQCGYVGLTRPTTVSNANRGILRENFASRIELRFVDLERTKILDRKIRFGDMLLSRRLTWSKAENASKLGPRGEESMRGRISMDVPEDPLFLYKLTVSALKENRGTEKWKPICIRQTDNRKFESKFWGNTNNANIAVHGRGAYNFGHQAEVDRYQFGGIDLDIFSLEFPETQGISIKIEIDWFSSLARSVYRHYSSVLVLMFIWAVSCQYVQLSQIFAQKIITKKDKKSDVIEDVRVISSITALSIIGLRRYGMGIITFMVLAGMYLQEAILSNQVISRNNIKLQIFLQNLLFGYRGNGYLAPLFPILTIPISFGLSFLLFCIMKLICEGLALLLSIRAKKNLYNRSLAAAKLFGDGSKSDTHSADTLPEHSYNIGSLALFSAENGPNCCVYQLTKHLNTFADIDDYDTSMHDGYGEATKNRNQDCVIKTSPNTIKSLTIPGSSFSLYGMFRPIFVIKKTLIMLVVVSVLVNFFVPYQLIFIAVFICQALIVIRKSSYCRLINDLLNPAHRKKCLKCANLVRYYKNAVNYRLGMLYIWFQLIPFCVFESLTWFRNISVHWFDNAMSAHQYFRILPILLLITLSCKVLTTPSSHLDMRKSNGSNMKIAGISGDSLETFYKNNRYYITKLVIKWFYFSIIAISALFGFARPFLMYDFNLLISLFIILLYFLESKY